MILATKRGSYIARFPGMKNKKSNQNKSTSTLYIQKRKMQAALSALTTREAVADALYRAVLAFDTDDQALLDSALALDAVFDLDGRIMNGLDAIHSECFATVSKLDTTHFISNVRINVVEGASEASMTASALSQHFRPGAGKTPGATNLMAGSLYFIDLVKDEVDGLWKMKNWKMKLIWSNGDWGVMSGN